MTNKDIILAVQKIIAGAPPAALSAYLYAILYTTWDDKGHHLGDKYKTKDFSKEAVSQAKKDLNSFWQKARKLIKDENPGHIANDFWFTRNNLSSGSKGESEFLGGDYDKEKGKALTKISKNFNQLETYVKEKKIYFEED